LKKKNEFYLDIFIQIEVLGIQQQLWVDDQGFLELLKKIILLEMLLK
jgi:hypothetical protein